MHYKSPLSSSAVFVLALTLFLGVLFWLPQMSAAAGETAIVATDVLNVRSGPGTDYGIITKVGLNEKFPVLDKSGDWYKVQLAYGGSGWVAGWLVSVETPWLPKSPQDTGKVAVINGSYVNVRSGPGTGYSIVAQAGYGERYSLLEASGDWYRIRLNNGSEGWIAGWLVNLEVPSPSNTAPDNGSQAGGKVAVVTGSIVNVRSGPGTSNGVITQVSQGDSLQVTGQSGDWYSVKLPSGGTGWVAGWLVSVKEVPSSPADPGQGSEPSRGGDRGTEAQSGKVLSMKVANSGSKTSAVIETDKPFDYKSFFLSNPDRFVVDLVGVAIGGLPTSTEVNSKTVSQVRAGYFQKNPDITRVVFDLSSGAQYVASLSADRMTLTVETYIPDVVGSLKNRVIAIDPGHGGPDPGAIGANGTKEKNITLDVANRVAKLLQAQGAKVIMTRSGDSDIGLYERTAKANSAKADVFISIHINANNDRSYGGTSTYVYNGEGSTGQAARIQESRRLARYVQTELIRALGLRDIGIKDANFVVLRTSNMPAILCELAFISNASEEKLMNTDSFKNKAAEAIVKGLGIYLSEKRTA